MELFTISMWGLAGVLSIYRGIEHLVISRRAKLKKAEEARQRYKELMDSTLYNEEYWIEGDKRMYDSNDHLRKKACSQSTPERVRGLQGEALRKYKELREKALHPDNEFDMLDPSELPF